MVIKNLQLTNFRNFSETKLKFRQTTLIVGKNAQGKSNLLESIYFLATTKSARAERDSQLIKEGENFCHVQGEIGEVQNNEEMTKLEIATQVRPEKMESVEKRIKVNGITRRVVDYLGHLVVVYFSPEDINLVSGSPSLRRSYLDLTLSQVDREYKKALSGYTNTLVARNRLLKGIQEGTVKISELDFWTGELLKWGKVLGQKREHFFLSLNKQSQILGSQVRFLGRSRFIYLESIFSEERLHQYLDREIAAGISLIGPHRDDFFFELNNHNLAYFGSRGEQRTAVLELKLAELQYIKNTKETIPVLLLDDIFSEFDEEHRNYVMTMTHNQQTILTAVEADQISNKFLEGVDIWEVKEGKLKSTSGGT